MQAAIRPAKTNHDTGILGIIAVVCMIFDHVGVVFFPSQVWFRVVGRIALPLFAWGIAIGAQHTRSMGRYALRLFVLMLVSQPLYMFALNHAILDLNIFATLLLGLLGIWGLKEDKLWLTAAALMLSHLIKIDYGMRGVLCILLLWGVRNNPLGLAVCFSAYCVIWGEPYMKIWTNDYFTLGLQTTAILALPLMLYPRAKRTPAPRWLMYAAYPAHLAVLWLLKAVL